MGTFMPQAAVASLDVVQGAATGFGLVLGFAAAVLLGAAVGVFAGWLDRE